MDQFEPALKICRISWMLLLNFFNKIKYHMSWCKEHEKYPSCVRLCTVVSVVDNLFVTVDRNTLYTTHYTCTCKKYLVLTWASISISSLRSLQQCDLEFLQRLHLLRRLHLHLVEQREVSEVSPVILIIGGRVGVLQGIEDVEQKVSVQALKAELTVGWRRRLLVLGVVLRKRGSSSFHLFFWCEKSTATFINPNFRNHLSFVDRRRWWPPLPCGSPEPSALLLAS